ncbi:MAG: CRTAC1 family protein [Deinococcales bacterium]
MSHITQAHQAEIGYYDSNGAGVGLADLDNEGYLDIVLANLKGNNSIFWNEGGLNFRKESLAHGDSRGVSLVDADGDGKLDIVFSQNLASLSYWQQSENGFVKEALRGVNVPAYSQVWEDFDRDGDLDLVTASYDSLLEKELKDSFLFSQGAGVVYYEQDKGRFTATRLSPKAQALALIAFDVNQDNYLDIIVGNDFEMPDEVFLNPFAKTKEGTWLKAQPFNLTSQNTMSFEVGDVGADGLLELFSADMKPYQQDAQSLAAWQPILQSRRLANIKVVNQNNMPQQEANVLQQRLGNSFVDVAQPLGIEASGWSWSAKLADFDQDGQLDLYVVNGMIAKDIFSHLPKNELIEANQAFRFRDQVFKPVPSWRLDAPESGRGMMVGDLDNDGDLDIVVNNLASPSQIFENQLCQGQSLEVELRWLGSQNSRVLGAELRLYTDHGMFLRTLRSNSGYLSGDPPRVHFGFPENSILQYLEIRWPDGITSQHDYLKSHQLLYITRE